MNKIFDVQEDYCIISTKSIQNSYFFPQIIKTKIPHVISLLSSLILIKLFFTSNN
jgi:hypothetical protein